MPWAGLRPENRPLSRGMHKEECRPFVRLTSSAPVFANGAVTAAMAFSFGEAARRRSFGQTDSTAGETLTAEQRAEVFGKVKEELIQKGLLSSDQSIKFENRFAVADPGEFGTIGRGIDGSKIRFFDSLDAASEFISENPNFLFLNGLTSGSHITIFAGGTLPGTRRFGVPHFETFNFTARGRTAFTVFHELQHLNVGRGGTSLEATANRRAFSLLRENGFCTSENNC